MRRVLPVAAALSVLTLASRVLGFGRWLVFSKTVGDTCLGDVYTATNKLPNVLFEVVAGGILAGIVVPVLGRHVAAGRSREAGETTSALLTWTLLVLTPAGLAAVVGAPLYAAAFVSAGCPGGVGVGTTLLLSFAPQVWLYGLAVVAAGVLQAHHRFVAAAAAPLLSALVVIAAYVVFAGVAGAGGVERPATLPGPAVAVLGWGTTLGVAVLAATTTVALSRLGLRLRPRLRFAAGDAPHLGRIAGAGVAGLVAQQLTTLFAVWAAQRAGDPGAVTRNEWANAVYLLPFAVLVAPLLQIVFPRLTAVADQGWAPCAAALGGTGRLVVVLGGLGTALLGAVAVPTARVFVLGPGSGRTAALAAPIAAFAPAVLGFALLGLANRVLLAHRLAAPTAATTVTAWLVVAAGIGAALLAGVGDGIVTAVAAATSLGMVAGAVVGWVAVHRAARRAPGTVSISFGLAAPLVRAVPVAALVAVGVGLLGRGADVLALGPALLAAVGCALASVVLYGAAMVALERSLLGDLRRLVRTGRAR